MKRTTPHTVLIGAAVALLGSACREAQVTLPRAADDFATSVEQAAGKQTLTPRLVVVRHQIDTDASELGKVVLITFGDRTLFESPVRMNGALAVLAAAADRVKGELRDVGVRFVEFQAGDSGTRAIVPVTRLLLLANGAISADELRTTVSVEGNCCPPKTSHSPVSS